MIFSMLAIPYNDFPIFRAKISLHFYVPIRKFASIPRIAVHSWHVCKMVCIYISSLNNHFLPQAGQKNDSPAFASSIYIRPPDLSLAKYMATHYLYFNKIYGVLGSSKIFRL